MSEEALGESLEVVTPDNQNTGAADQIADPALQQENTDADAAERHQKDEDDDSHRVPKGVQKRIDRLTRERYRLEGELEAMRRQQAERETSKPAAQASRDDSAKPTPDQFGSYEEFTAALVRHEAKELLKAEREQEAQSRAQKESQERSQAWSKKVEAAREAYPDFDDALSEDVRVTPAMADVLQRHEKGADLAYYLGKHPDEAARIAQLDPVSTAIAMAEIGASLARPAPKKTTGAPPPISPVGQRAAVSKDPDKMTTAEWLEWRNAQLRKK